MLKNQELIKNAYAAFNARDISAVLSVMHPQIKWSKAWEGDYANGHDEVSAYWQRQWKEIDPTVTPVGFLERKNGTLAVEVYQLVKDLDGNVLFDGKVTHVYVFNDGLLQQMNIELYVPIKDLVGVAPADVLIHGPTKLLLTEYLWHSPAVGIIASYSPSDLDVANHFGIFRGVDQIESFAQATIVSCGAFSESIKQGLSFDQLKQNFIPVFTNIGQVNFHGYLELGDVFISIGVIKHYKFRQMIADGRIYKVPHGLNLNDYFSDFNEQRLEKYDLSPDFKLIAELFDVTGRAIRQELFKKN